MGLFSFLTGGKSEKRDTTYQGPRPASSQSQLKGGNELYNEIINRLQGRGVGFGNEYASTYANPIIRNMRNRFSSYVVPELKSELSAQGRRRGSGGFQQLSQAYQDQAYQEGDVFSQLQQRNENQKRSEINAALNSLGTYVSNEGNLLDRYSAFEYGDHNRQLAEVSDRQDARAKAAQSMLQAAGQLSNLPLTSISRYTGGHNVSLPNQSFQYGGRTITPSTPTKDFYNRMAARYAPKYGQVGRVL